MEPVSQEIGAGPADPPAVMVSPARSGSRTSSDEMTASLAAVRAASDAARARLRRDTRKVRLLTATVLAAICVPALLLTKRWTGARGGEPVAPVAAVPDPGASRPAPPVAADEGAAPTSRPTAAAATVPAPVTAPAQPSASHATETEAPARPAADVAETLAACREAYDAHHWPVAIEACARAADLRPLDPALDMKVAQAYHARGRYADAGVWARRALGLSGVDPEALVILAHAERRAGHPAAARDAYRRYLALAPRGWHVAEARAAVRPAASGHPRARTETGAAGGEAPVVSSDEPSAEDR